MNPFKLINDIFTDMDWFTQYVITSMTFLWFLGASLIFFQPEGSLELAKSLISYAGVYVVCSVIIIGAIYCLAPDDDNEKPSGNKRQSYNIVALTAPVIRKASAVVAARSLNTKK